MVIRRSDARRRRVGVLIEENNVAPVESSGGTAENLDLANASIDSETQPSVNEYSNSARRRHLSKTTDLIPKRVRSWVLVVLSMLTMLGLVNVLHVYASDLVPVFGARALEVFSMTAQGGMSQWFATLLLLISGMASLQIYALRQHRSNDYRGTYKLWLFLSMLLLFASLNSAVALHELVINAINAITGLSLLGNGWVWGALKVVALSLIVARGVVEVRQSRGAILGVAIVWLAYTSAVVMQLPTVQMQADVELEPVYGNLMLVGSMAMLLTILTYARFVYLHAQGLLMSSPAVVKTNSNKARKSKQSTASKSRIDETKRRKTKTKPAEKVVAEKAETTEAELEQAPKPKRRKNSKKKSAQASSEKQETATESSSESTQEVTESSDSSSVSTLPLGGKLSKTMKRKLRKQQKQQKQQRRAA